MSHEVHANINLERNNKQVNNDLQINKQIQIDDSEINKHLQDVDSHMNNSLEENSLEQKGIKKKKKFVGCLRTNLLTILTVLGVVLGITVGLILRETSNKPWTPRQIMYINFVGDLFLRLLKSLILPLIVSSLISAIANLDLSLSGKIATRAIFYYMSTTVLAIILGLILGLTIQPGKGRDGELITHGEEELRNVTMEDTLLDLVRNMFPPNLIEACIYQYRTVLIPPPPENYTISIEKKRQFSKHNLLLFLELHDWKISEENANGMNILGLVVFSAIMGVTLAHLREEGRFLAKFFQGLMTAMMKITTMVIWLSPIGIFFLVCSKILEVDDFGKMVEQLGLYFATVLGGILFHGFVILPLIFTLTTRTLPFKYVMNMGQAVVTAFGTSSR